MIILQECMMDGSWDDLKVFLAVARGGTLAAAGEALGVNPSTVHRRVRALEGDLGVRLFDKDPRGYALTGAGEALLPQAEAMEASAYAARRAAAGHDASPAGPVRVTLPSDLLPVVLPALRALREACPRLVPELIVAERAMDLGRETDLALRMSTRPPGDAVGWRIATVGWARYAVPGLAADAPWAVYLGMDEVPAVQWRRRAWADAPVALRVARVDAMAQVLASGGLHGMLPCHVGDRAPELARVGAPIPEAASALWVLLHTDLRRSARARAFLDVATPWLRSQARVLEGLPPKS